MIGQGALTLPHFPRTIRKRIPEASARQMPPPLSPLPSSSSSSSSSSPVVVARAGGVLEWVRFVTFVWAPRRAKAKRPRPQNMLNIIAIVKDNPVGRAARTAAAGMRVSEREGSQRGTRVACSMSVGRVFESVPLDRRRCALRQLDEGRSTGIDSVGESVPHWVQDAFQPFRLARCRGR